MPFFKPLTVFSIAFLWFCGNSVRAQLRFPIESWVQKMADKNSEPLSGFLEINQAIFENDPATVAQIFNALESKLHPTNAKFMARFYMARAYGYEKIFRNQGGRARAMAELDKANHEANKTRDESFIMKVSWVYGDLSMAIGKLEHAAMYSQLSLDIKSKLKQPLTSYECWKMGQILYSTRDYHKSLYYLRKADDKDFNTISYDQNFFTTNMPEVSAKWNGIGLCFQKLGQLDSALHYFNIGLRLAENTNSTIWLGISAGCIGVIYCLQHQYEKAKPLLDYGYQICKTLNEEGTAAQLLQWSSRIDQMEGKSESALQKATEALQLFARDRNRNLNYQQVYLQNIYEALAGAFTANHLPDSARKYQQRYQAHFDSTELSIANARFDITRIKLDNLRSQMEIGEMKQQQKKVIRARNLTILGIILLAMMAILFLSKQQQKIKFQQQLAQQSQAAASREMEAAQQQFSLFKQNIIEKTTLIEKLQHQLSGIQEITKQQNIITELSQYTILTDEDWNRFKPLFETLNPLFLQTLKASTPDITLAEQRMAALLRLQLNNKEMAAIQGISVDSVRKSKQRLRNRLELNPEESLENYIASL